MKKEYVQKNERIGQERKIIEIIKNRKRKKFLRNRTLPPNEESSISEGPKRRVLERAKSLEYVSLQGLFTQTNCGSHDPPNGGHPTETVELPLEDIIPDPNQPRKNFDDAKLKELAQSIEQHGLLQPILVRPIRDRKFEIIHGERRWRACKLIEKKTILAQVRNISDKEKIEIQLIENLQREDLNPIEEAETYEILIEKFNYTHEQIGKKIGKSREYVTNKLRLLQLPSEVQEKIKRKELTEGHARVILSLKEPTQQKEIAQKVAEESMRVRDAEELIHELKNRDVSRETVPSEAKTLLVPVSSEVYSLLEKVARRMKLKIEAVIERATKAFLRNEGFSDGVD